MDVFVQTALSFPTVLFSFLLCLAMLYWCVAALGILEVDLLDIEADSALDSVQPEGLAGLLLRLGLNGVPVTLVLSLLFFFAWLASYFVELLLLSHLPLGVLRYPLACWWRWLPWPWRCRPVRCCVARYVRCSSSCKPPPVNQCWGKSP